MVKETVIVLKSAPLTLELESLIRGVHRDALRIIKAVSLGDVELKMSMVVKGVLYISTDTPGRFLVYNPDEISDLPYYFTGVPGDKFRDRIRSGIDEVTLGRMRELFDTILKDLG